jgi:hypothetical protein
MAIVPAQTKRIQQCSNGPRFLVSSDGVARSKIGHGGGTVAQRNELLFQNGVNFNHRPVAADPQSLIRAGRRRIMGVSRDDFTKYPRTPHLFGSRGTDDDKHLDAEESERFIADPSLIVEEKLDGTNVGIHFTSAGRIVLQCRGHEITSGMHPQYDLFKQWATAKRPFLEDLLQDEFILFGEWLYARHSVHYRRLPHYFFEFDIYDKCSEAFLDLERRLAMLEETGIRTVPVIHRGSASADELRELIGLSQFDSAFENPLSGQTDSLMEGLYLRIEAEGRVAGRAKLVRPEFVERVKQSEHWQHQTMIPNLLADDAEIWP